MITTFVFFLASRKIQKVIPYYEVDFKSNSTP